MFTRKEYICGTLGIIGFLIFLWFNSIYGIPGNYVSVSENCDGYGISKNTEFYFDAKDILSYRVNYGQKPPSQVIVRIKDGSNIRQMTVSLPDEEVLEFRENADACINQRKTAK